MINNTVAVAASERKAAFEVPHVGEAIKGVRHGFSDRQEAGELAGQVQAPVKGVRHGFSDRQEAGELAGQVQAPVKDHRLQVLVHLTSGNTLVMNATVESSISDLKEYVSIKVGIPQDRQVIMIECKLVEDRVKLCSLLREGTFLVAHLSVRVPGGIMLFLQHVNGKSTGIPNVEWHWTVGMLKDALVAEIHVDKATLKFRYHQQLLKDDQQLEIFKKRLTEHPYIQFFNE